MTYPIRTKRVSNQTSHWEKIIAKYITGAGITGFSWDVYHLRFTGLKGLRFVRYSTHVKDGWRLIPQEWRKYETIRNNNETGELVMFLTNKRAMPYVTDVYVLTKLDTFTDLLVAAVNADPERYYRKD